MSCHDICIERHATFVRHRTIVSVAERALAVVNNDVSPPVPPVVPPSPNNLMDVEPTTVWRRRRSELDRWRILVYFDDGQTVTQIAIQLKCSRNTVYRWIRAYFRNDVNELKGSRGRKRKLSPDTVATIAKHVKRSSE